MEDGLVPRQIADATNQTTSLNPCCNGRWSRTLITATDGWRFCLVLILVVMEDGLVHGFVTSKDEVGYES